jgi:hypothetical protein
MAIIFLIFINYEGLLKINILQDIETKFLF